MTNELYYGDNLDILRRKIASASVDLSAIDSSSPKVIAQGRPSC